METLNTVIDRECNSCHTTKPLNLFHKAKNGYRIICIACVNNDRKKRYMEFKLRPEWLEAHKKRIRKSYNKLKQNPEWLEFQRSRVRKNHRKFKHRSGPEVAKVARAKYISRFPEKIKARNACRRLACPEGSHKHHWSYHEDHHKDVIILSERDHGKVHRFITYDQEHFQYRRIDSEALLDSREVHEAYINFVIANEED